MTRQHFEEIAAAFKRRTDLYRRIPNGAPQLVALELLADDLAAGFEDRNPRFDYDRFMTACGFEVE